MVEKIVIFVFFAHQELTLLTPFELDFHIMIRALSAD